MTAEHLIKSIADIYTDCLNLALEAAIGMVDLVTQKSFQVLAEQRMKAEGRRSLQDPIELEGPDMNAAYPKVQ